MTPAGPAGSWLAHDSEHLLAATAALGDHLAGALRAPLPALGQAGTPRSVVVLGMGGSGVAGAVLAALAAPCSPVPVVLVNGYEAPSFVSPEDLVVAVSCSGETEETLEATAACLGRGAPVVAITKGGSLGALVASGGGSVVELPAEIPQPRAGIGAMTAPLLLLAESAGVLPGARGEVEAARAQLDRRLPTLLDGGGEAAEVARRIGRTIPLVYGAAGLGAVAARRWKTQVNENAKAPAFDAAVPEACHNEICGFGQSGDVTRQVLTLVELRSGHDHPQVARRFDLVAELVAETVAAIVTVSAEGETELARFFDLVAIGDVVSLHLAAAEDVDPGPVPVLVEMKRRLRES